MTPEQQRIKRGQESGRRKSVDSPNKSLGRVQREKLLAHYQSRRIRDAKQAKEMGVSDKFMRTAAARYIRGERD